MSLSNADAEIVTSANLGQLQRDCFGFEATAIRQTSKGRQFMDMIVL
jgi:hypothetical protein